MSTTSLTATAPPLWFVDNLAYVHVDGEQTAGAYSLGETWGRRGDMPPLAGRLRLRIRPGAPRLGHRKLTPPREESPGDDPSQRRPAVNLADTQPGGPR